MHAPRRIIHPVHALAPPSILSVILNYIFPVILNYIARHLYLSVFLYGAYLPTARMSPVRCCVGGGVYLLVQPGPGRRTASS